MHWDYKAGTPQRPLTPPESGRRVLCSLTAVEAFRTDGSEFDMVETFSDSYGNQYPHETTAFLISLVSNQEMSRKKTNTINKIQEYQGEGHKHQEMNGHALRAERAHVNSSPSGCDLRQERTPPRLLTEGASTPPLPVPLLFVFYLSVEGYPKIYPKYMFIIPASNSSERPLK